MNDDLGVRSARVILRAASAATVGAVAATAIFHAASPGQTPASARPAAFRQVSSATQPHHRSIAAVVDSLTTAQLAGQRLIYAYAGLTPPAALVSLIRQGEAAGVVLFSTNVSSDAQVSRVIAALQHAALTSPVGERILILTDQEGGLVRRLPGAPELSEREIGESPNASNLATAAGHDAGVNLRSAGVNVNLAPVVDVFRTPGNFIDRYGRSYSSDPALVARLGADFIRAQQAVGPAATAKHFPGLGAATRQQDTDAGPVTLATPLTTLRSADELPYRRAIAAGVKLIMTSWATYPALDPTRPAGLSRAVIDGELRGHLGFKGVTITDSLAAGAAAAAVGDLGRRGELAVAAGNDLILAAATVPAANNVSEGVSVMKALVNALRSRRLGMSPFRAAVSRILALRAHP